MQYREGPHKKRSSRSLGCVSEEPIKEPSLNIVKKNSPKSNSVGKVEHSETLDISPENKTQGTEAGLIKAAHTAIFFSGKAVGA